MSDFDSFDDEDEKPRPFVFIPLLKIKSRKDARKVAGLFWHLRYSKKLPRTKAFEILGEVMTLLSMGDEEDFFTLVKRKPSKEAMEFITVWSNS